MASNFYMYFVAALIPLAVGFVWYNPKVLGQAWMDSCGFKQEDLEGANMGVIFGLCYLFGLMIALVLQSIVIHQLGVFSLLAPEAFEAGPIQDAFNQLMVDYGGRYRTFGHGALHGGTTALFIGLPLIGTTALFERRGWKYIWIHTGYWFVSLLLMGGVLCQTLHFEL